MGINMEYMIYETRIGHLNKPMTYHFEIKPVIFCTNGTFVLNSSRLPCFKELLEQPNTKEKALEIYNNFKDGKEKNNMGRYT